MTFKIYFNKIRFRSVQAVTIAAILILLTISAASATLLTIDTNDNSAADWNSQPIFLFDPDGDLNTACAGGDARDDMIETYVVNGPSGSSERPTEIYFLVKFAETDTGLEALQYHWLSAYMDCAPPGEDPMDANVIYRGYPDQVMIGNGTLPIPGIVYLYDSNGEEGQRVTNDTTSYTMEWKGSYIIMSQFTQPGPLNCTPDRIARIKFTAFRVDSTGNYLCTYDESGWREFNIPTAVEMVSIKTNNHIENTFLIISIVTLLAAIVVAAIGFTLSRITR